MSFLKKAAGVFWEFDEAKPVIAIPLAPIGVIPHANTPYLEQTSFLNQEMINNLTIVSMARKTAYTTFIDASKKLEQIIPDETTRIKAAFVTVSGEGKGLEQMLQAIDVHISDVESEKDRFNTISSQSQKTQVEDIQAKAKSLLSENDEIALQITSLQEQITSLVSKTQTNFTWSQTLNLQAEEDAHKIISVKEDFFKAAEIVQSNLASRKSMLASLIPKD